MLIDRKRSHENHGPIRIKGSGEYWILVKHKGRRSSKKIGPPKLALQVAENIQARLLLASWIVKKNSRNPHPYSGTTPSFNLMMT